MVLVILTESNPLEGITTVFRRCFILLIPLSLVFCKYFPDIGRSQEKHFEPDTWIGVATHKNTLGPLTLLSTFYFLWEIVENDKGIRLISMVYLLMSIYLLNGNSNNRSVTSITLLLVALSLYAFLRRYKSNPRRLRVVVTYSIIAIFTLVFLDQVALDGLLKNSLFQAQGRDPTLTGRSLLWNDLIALGMKNPILGYGFGGFWTPERMAYLKELHPWGPGESHNGYIEIFITTGIIGVIIFCSVVITAMKGAFRQSTEYFEYGLFRLIFLIIVLVHNYSEAGFLRPTHLMWFVFLLMAVNISYAQLRPLESRIAGAQIQLRHKIINYRIHKLEDTR
ncbi:MAG: O-antigen ligase family protein [Candidatus Competibacteraceae bacterium]